MVASIEAQKELWKNPEYTLSKNKRKDGKTVSVSAAVKPWFKREGDAVYLSPRYGVRPFQVMLGQPIAKAGPVEPFLDALKGAVSEGEFDAQLAKLAERGERKG